MRILAGSLVLIAALGACRGPQVAGSLSIPVSERGTLGFSGSEQEGAQWFLRQGGQTRPLPTPPVTLFPVATLSSPDGRYLAVLSVGEGHPILDILDIDRVVAGTHGDRSLLCVDPYPGMIELVGWEGGWLKVRSDRPLASGLDASGRAPGMDIAESASLYAIHVVTGEIRPE